MGTVLGRDSPAPMAPLAEEAPAVVPLDKEEPIDPDLYESPPGLPVRAEPISSARATAAVVPERRRSERLESMRRVRTRTAATRGGLDRAPGRECRAHGPDFFSIPCLLFSRVSAGYVRVLARVSCGCGQYSACQSPTVSLFSPVQPLPPTLLRLAN